MISLNSISFDKGTLTFRIPEGSLDYKDNKFFYMINYEGNGGSLKIYKDVDNGIKVKYVYDGKGYCNLNTMADMLDDNDEHVVHVTWSLEDRKIVLYIDGQEKDSGDISLEPINNSQS